MSYDITDLVYPSDLPAGLTHTRLPGKIIAPKIDYLIENEKLWDNLESKVEHSCRKICMMCLAQTRTLAAERDFYSLTVKESPALFGEDAIEIAYHLESFIFFARSSLDVASAFFSNVLLNGRKTDSFNELTKNILKRIRQENSKFSEEFQKYISVYEQDPGGWFPILCGSECGRALRDKIAHQTGLPISYAEYKTGSDKERPFVKLSDKLSLPMEDFMEIVREGVIENYINFEEECIKYKDRIELEKLTADVSEA